MAQFKHDYPIESVKQEVIKNQDVIDFRTKLIDMYCGKVYIADIIPVGNRSNVLTPERKEALEDILIMFNNHFGSRNYDLG